MSSEALNQGLNDMKKHVKDSIKPAGEVAEGLKQTANHFVEARELLAKAATHIRAGKTSLEETLSAAGVLSEEVRNAIGNASQIGLEKSADPNIQACIDALGVIGLKTGEHITATPDIAETYEEQAKLVDTVKSNMLDFASTAGARRNTIFLMHAEGGAPMIGKILDRYQQGINEQGQPPQ